MQPPGPNVRACGLLPLPGASVAAGLPGAGLPPAAGPSPRTGLPVRSWTKPAARIWAALAGLAAWPLGIPIYLPDFILYLIYYCLCPKI